MGSSLVPFVIASGAISTMILSGGADRLTAEPTSSTLVAGDAYTQALPKEVQSRPVCKDCTPGILIDKEERVFNITCWQIDSVRPFRYQTYNCRRYTCENGYYYTRTDPTSQGACFIDPLTSTCPDGSCLTPKQTPIQEEQQDSDFSILL